MNDADRSVRRRWAFVAGFAIGAALALAARSAGPGAALASATSALRPAACAFALPAHLARSALSADTAHPGHPADSREPALAGELAFLAGRIAGRVTARDAVLAVTARAGSRAASAAARALSLAQTGCTPASVALAPTAATTPSFAWPVDGEVSSCYGERWGRIHVGVDIAAPDGAPVLASRAGRVVYSGSLPGYGNLLLIEHAGGWYTVYGHNQIHLVEATGDGRALVEAGQVIARVGRTGNATGPHVHFEIRRSIDAVDPLSVLPRRIQTALRAP